MGGFWFTGESGRDGNKFLTSLITLFNRKMCQEAELLDFSDLENRLVQVLADRA